MPVPDHVKGLLFALGGVLVISPDSLLVRMMTVDLWTVMLLRGSFIALTLLGVQLLFIGRDLASPWRKMDRPAWGMVMVMALSSFFFVAAVQTTSVAHTLIIVGSVPVFAALLGLVLLREQVPLHTWISILLVVGSLIFVVNDQQQSTLAGDLLAFIACLSWSYNFILARQTTCTNTVFIMMLCGLVMALTSLPMADFASISASQLGIGFLLGAFNGIALALLVYAPRFIPSAEVAIFLPVETVLGTLLVWWLIGEFPGPVSIIAGIVIVATISVNSYLRLKQEA